MIELGHPWIDVAGALAGACLGFVVFGLALEYFRWRRGRGQR